MKRTFTHL